MKRRSLLKYAGVLGISTTLSILQLKANAPIKKTETTAVGYVKMKLGKLDILIITDGHLLIQPAQPIFAPGIDKIKVEEALVDNFISNYMIDAAINILLIKKEKKIIIIDAGCGSAIGDQAGKFLKNLNTAGITADEVTDVVITHLHVDHIGGLIDLNGNLVFKNATYYLAQKEHDFWMSKEPDFSQSKNKASNEDSILLARNTISAIKHQLKLYNFGDSFFDCIKTALAEGHTPGHAVLTIFSDNKSLKHIVDTVHTTLLISHPEWGTEWDIDFQKGVSTRERILEEQFMSKGLTMSCHLPWPGLGYIAKNENRYLWIPMPIATPYI